MLRFLFFGLMLIVAAEALVMIREITINTRKSPGGPEYKLAPILAKVFRGLGVTLALISVGTFLFTVIRDFQQLSIQ